MRLIASNEIGTRGVRMQPQTMVATVRPYIPNSEPDAPSVMLVADVVQRLTTDATIPDARYTVANAVRPTARSRMRPSGSRPAAVARRWSTLQCTKMLVASRHHSPLVVRGA